MFFSKLKQDKAETLEETAGNEETPAEEPKTGETPAEKEPEEASAAEPEEPKVETPPAIDWKDRYVRLLADFDNFKKRTARDREDTYFYAEKDILEDILPTVDSLALALSNAQSPDDPFVKGVQMVYDSLLAALQEHGAKPFDSVGEELDTAKMEAIAQLPSAEIEEGKVSNEVKKGWMLNGKVLRAAQVVVSSGAQNG